VRVTLCGESRKSSEELFGAVGINTLECDQLSKSVYHFDIQQVGNNERFVTSGQIVSKRLSQGAICE
jgi:hypothetical protein